MPKGIHLTHFSKARKTVTLTVQVNRCLKAYPHRAKAVAKAKIFFVDCYLFFDLFCLSFYLFTSAPAFAWCEQALNLFIRLKLTFGDVAAARSGSSPPHAVTRLSASCEIMCVTFTTNTWFSEALTKSITVFVLCL